MLTVNVINFDDHRFVAFPGTKSHQMLIMNLKPVPTPRVLADPIASSNARPKNPPKNNEPIARIL